MRRKELKKKKLRENSFDSFFYKKYKNFSPRKVKILLVKHGFLDQLEGRRIKKLYKLNFISNYGIFRNFINDFKLKKGNLFYKTLLKDKRFIITQPVYAFKKQFNELRSNTITFEKNYFLKSLPVFSKKLDFFKINYDKNNFRVGLNYYSFYKNLNSVKSFEEDIIKDENKNLVFIKSFNDDYKNDFLYNFQYYFNYNLFIINSIEIYKLLIYLHVYSIIKINIKYI